MPNLLRLSIATLLTLAVSAGPAAAATTAEQLLELSKAGLSDDILIALIQSDGSVFKLTAADVLALHRAGLSERVILAMASTLKPPAAPAAIRTEPAAATVAPEERPAPQPAPQPVVNVTQNVTQRVEQSSPRPDPFYNYNWPIYLPAAPIVRQPLTPVYWGYGGQRRPDSWDDRGPADNKPADPKRDH